MTTATVGRAPNQASAGSALLPLGGTLDLLRGPDGATPTADVGLPLALLRDLGPSGGWLRVHRPAPTVAFSRLDTLSPGFGRAVAVARERGFAPVLRGPGGRAVAYDQGSVCVDLVVADGDPRAGIRARFQAFSELLLDALGQVCVHARVGALPDEYCPGEHSVHAGPRKLAGTAQRIVRRGWYLGAVLLVEGSDRVRGVVEPVYAALGQPLDPTTVGAVQDVAPEVDVEAVAAAVVAATAARVPLRRGRPTPDLMARGAQLALRHDLLGQPPSCTRGADR